VGLIVRDGALSQGQKGLYFQTLPWQSRQPGLLGPILQIIRSAAAKKFCMNPCAES
jgi:hypothetical protein